MEIQTTLAKLGLFDAKVPRYTSYPTSPHFSGGIEASDFAQWTTEIPAGAEISLYVHVPFCRRLCWFCACRTQGTQSMSPVAAYVETLRREIVAFGELLPEGVKLSRLHWGGGTPTLLDPATMEALGRAIFDVVPMAETGEFSVEIDPNEVDAARLDALKDLGMNRASIGVQDFDPIVQDTIGRHQPFDLTRDVVEMLRARGIQSLNADILYGLPHQNAARMTASVQKLLSLSPDRVALYGYAHVPWMARRQSMIPSDLLPTPQDRRALFDVARRLFLWDGYNEIGIDHFATRQDGLSVAQRRGRLRRNFQGYTDDASDVLVGLGASAISRFPKGYAQNHAATSQYTAAIREGRFATGRGHRFSEDDKLRGRIIEAIMCDFRVDQAELERDFGLSASTFEALMAPLVATYGDLVSLTPEHLYISEDARVLTRMIARSVDAYDLSKAGHSSAV